MPEPLLKIEHLDAFYGKSHALQGVALHVNRGELVVVVGRNGMGKTTLLKSIMGMPPLSRTGSIIFDNQETIGKSTHEIASLGIGFVPQGRMLFPSLTVDEHLRFAWSHKKDVSDWSPDAVYELFPELEKRAQISGALLSGGEQQMLTVGRALVTNPLLLMMDEPSEGLSTLVIQRVEEVCRHLISGGMSILLVEQNLEMAQSLAERAYVFVNGKVARELSAESIAADRRILHQILGVSVETGGIETEPPEEPETPEAPEELVSEALPETVIGASAPTLWSGTGILETRAPALDTYPKTSQSRIQSAALQTPVAHTIDRPAYIVGTFDTKAKDLLYIKSCLDRRRFRTITVDLSTSRKPSPASISPTEVARHHPKGVEAVFTGDRGTSVAGMAEAFRLFMAGRRDVGGIISAGGSGGDRPGDSGHEKLTGRNPQSDGLHGRFRQCPPVCGAVGHLHDVLGHGCGRHQPHFGPGPGQRRPCPGRYDRIQAGRRPVSIAGHRVDHVRSDHALCAGGRQGAANAL